MKKWLCLLLLLVASTAYAIVTTRNCTSFTGGTARSLDYISVSDCSNGDRAFVTYTNPSTNEDAIHYFRFNATGTDAEQTTVHPYTIRPDDYVTQGVWKECIGLNDLGSGVSNLYPPNSGVTETITVAQLVSGYIHVVPFAANANRKIFSLPAISTINKGAEFNVDSMGTGVSIYAVDGIYWEGDERPWVFWPGGDWYRGLSLKAVYSGTSIFWFVSNERVIPPGTLHSTGATLYGSD